MTRVLTFTIILLLTALQLTAEERGGKVIYIVSDTHVMDPSLLVNEGQAFNDMSSGDRKMLKESVEAFEAVVDRAINEKADVLLISGDLTKDGERVSHERVAQTLERALQAGVKPYVIPGNHDVNNNKASYYDGDRTYAAATVTADEFAGIYRNCGYGDTSDRYQNTLTYVCEPVTGLTLLCIDSSRLSDGVLQWLLTQADNATARGQQVVAMTHHHLVEHADGIQTLLNSLCTDNGDHIAQKLMAHGVRLVLSGHGHFSDAVTVWNQDHTKSLTEVTTGSTVTYPAHYRVATLSDDGSRLDIDTRAITTLPSKPDYTGYGRQHLREHIPGLLLAAMRSNWGSIQTVLNKYNMSLKIGSATFSCHMPETPEALIDLLFRHMGNTIIESVLIMHDGNEHQQNAYERLKGDYKRGFYDALGELIDKDVTVLGKPIGRNKAHNMIMEAVTPLLKSILDDINHLDTVDESRTDDLQLHITIGENKQGLGIETLDTRQRINVNNGVISVEGAEHVLIANMRGETVGLSRQTRVPQGPYIVKADGRVRKVLVR